MNRFMRQLHSAVSFHLRAFHSGRDRRIKLKHLAQYVLGKPCQHGSSTEVALRNTIADMVRRGFPIGSVSGPRGGVYYMTTEAERDQAIAGIGKQVNALRKRLASLRQLKLAA